ncbi:MAG: tryptophan--tRNA ligase [Kiritimatiellae bacterium]|nr:tryptophan--tRNA ligase [Kiritimatiellia bacterium]
MRILSGIQPSGKLHLGNYFGMIKPVLELQDPGEPFIFLANYHALTSAQDGAVLRQMTHDMALDLLACGLEPERGAFYRQSDIPELTELTWLLSNVTPMGLLERCHSFKDKMVKGIPANHGLFAYPLLMTADILAVQAEVVPVGRDQKQHLEVARDIAMKFNHLYGELFTIPKPLIRDDAALVPGIDGQKMSKSYNNTIEIFGDSTSVRKAIMRIVTDSKTVEEPKDPDENTIFALYQLVATDDQSKAMAERFRAGGTGYGDAKKELHELVEATIKPLRKKRQELCKDPGYIQRVLDEGAEKAREEVSKTLRRVRQAMGL